MLSVKAILALRILIQKFWPYYGRSIDCLGQLLYEEYLQLHCFSDEQSYRIYHLHLPVKCIAKILGRTVKHCESASLQRTPIQNLDSDIISHITTSCKRMQ